jgi:Ni,Fe-hydrogenase III small subunit
MRICATRKQKEKEGEEKQNPNKACTIILLGPMCEERERREVKYAYKKQCAPKIFSIAP